MLVNGGWCMVYSVYGLMGRVESLDRETVLDALDLPTDYPKEELIFIERPMIMGPHVWYVEDKNCEMVAIIHEEEV
jgi:hypothetical protein